jgi:hypothetical protein
MQAVRKLKPVLVKTNKIYNATKIVCDWLIKGEQQQYKRNAELTWRLQIWFNLVINRFPVRNRLGHARIQKKCQTKTNEICITTKDCLLSRQAAVYENLVEKADAMLFCILQNYDHSVTPLQTVQLIFIFVFCLPAPQRLWFLSIATPSVAIGANSLAQVLPDVVACGPRELRDWICLFSAELTRDCRTWANIMLWRKYRWV